MAPTSELLAFLQTGTKFKVQKSKSPTCKKTGPDGQKNPNYPSIFYFKRTQEFRGKKYGKQQTLRIPPPKLNRYLFIFDSIYNRFLKKKKKKDIAEAFPTPFPPPPSLPKQQFLSLSCNSHTFLTSYYNLSLLKHISINNT